MKRFLLLALVSLAHAAMAAANPKPVEIHDRLVAADVPYQRVALTLDACSGKFDDELIEFLIRNRIPATIFATKRWLLKNPEGVAIIKAHLDLFDVENHGENHIPAVIGRGKTVYGIPGEPDILHLRREVSEGARAISDIIGVAPRWYRGATAEYDAPAVDEIGKMGYKIACFSINADAGASLSRKAIVKRLQNVRSGDVIIAHMNKPASDSAEGLAVGLLELLRQHFVFVRLDQVDLAVVTDRK